tara:strand:+ start:47 stop:313 length:267 start_codon:yes stop_codon:yes gene_type:complete
LEEYLNHTNTNDVMNKDNFVEACLNCRWKFEHEVRSKLCFVTDAEDKNIQLKNKKMINQLLLRSSEFLSVNKNKSNIADNVDDTKQQL